MDLKAYIQGKRRGKKANRVERKAMQDPFLQEALDGFDTVQGDHSQIIEELGKRIGKKAKKRAVFSFPRRRVMGIAALIFLLVGIGSLIVVFLDYDEPVVLTENSKQAGETKKTEEEKEKSERVSSKAAPKVNSRQENMLSDKIAQSNNKKVGDAKEVMKLKGDTFDRNLEDHIVMADTPVFAEEKDLSTIYITEDVIPESSRHDTGKILENMQGVLSVDGQIQSVRGNRADGQKIIIDGVPVRESRQLSRIQTNQDREMTEPFFGEKEFKAFFEKNRIQDICAGEKASVNADFYLDTSGKPQNIKILQSSCEELEKELIRWLGQSPGWSGKQRNVKLKIVINK